MIPASTVRWNSLTISGVRSPLIESGPPNDPEAVVFCHGNPGSRLDWEDLVSRSGEFVRSNEVVADPCPLRSSIGCGGISTPEPGMRSSNSIARPMCFESRRSSGMCDVISMARPLLANVDLLDQFRAGRDLPERPCTFCNRCTARITIGPLEQHRDTAVRCLVVSRSRTDGCLDSRASAERGPGAVEGTSSPRGNPLL